MTVYQNLLEIVKNRGAGFLVLLDPDRLQTQHLARLAEQCADSDVDALLVGSSLMLSTRFDKTVAKIKERVSLPVIIFPGNMAQISSHADAILYLSLISGRSSHHLIEQQVRAAPYIKEVGIEPIATGYILVESGRLTSVQYMSATLPIPRDKPDIAKAHALAAQYLGMSLIFMDAGSGAQQAVPAEMIQAVDKYVDLPLVVGGGIREPRAAQERVAAGADFVVVGNAFEDEHSTSRLKEFAAAVHRG
jgi:putative glycerol-1-phosphate prenyltransferase